MFAQQTTPPASSFGETVEVRVINVEVVVTTRDGKPVTGLPKEAFELLTGGKPREISNFLEISEAGKPAAPGEEAPQDIRPRRIVFFVDNASLTPSRRNTVLKSMRRVLDEGMRNGDAMMIVTWNGNATKLALPMTTDRAAAEKAYAALASETTMSNVREFDRRQVPQNLNGLIVSYRMRVPPEQPPYSAGLGEVRTYADLAMRQTRLQEGAIRSVIAALRGVEGRKALVLITEAFSERPAQAAFEFFDAIKEQFDGGDSQNPLVDAKQFEHPTLVDSVAEAANSAGVTLYAIQAGGLGANQIMGDASDPSLSVLLSSARIIAFSPDNGTLETVAAATGGFALTNSNNFDLATNTLLADLGSYYSLGYRADGQREDRVTTIAVRLKNNPNKYKVRTRRTLVETSTASAVRDAVVANLFYPVAKNELKISLAAGQPAAGADSAKVTVPLQITIPMEQLTLMPEGTDLTGKLTVVGAFLRKDGAVSKLDQRQQTFRFPADSLKRRKEITMKLDLAAEAGTEGVSIGVVDEISRVTGFASTRLN